MKDDKKTPRPTVRTSVGQTDYKRSLAYQRLGIRPQDVEIAPFFRAQLRGIARCMKRGRDKDELPGSPVCPFSYLQYSSDSDARKVLAAYLSVPQSYRRLLPSEAFCHVAAVSPRRVLAIIAAVVVEQEAQVTAVLAAVRHTHVLEKTIERALQDEGSRERLMLHKATGFVPTWGWKGL